MENIVNTLDRVAQANPQKIAYDELGVTHTYQDFYEQSNALAAWIADQKLPEKSPILVYGDHQFEMVVAFTAAIKTGHPYIPVETGTGLERMDSIVATANPLLAIAIDEFPHAELANFNGQVLKDADLKQILATPQDFTVTNPVSGKDIFYILFTSGTTGNPKGVEVMHDNIKSYVEWELSDSFGIPEGASYLGQPPFSFDISNMSWLPALLTGGKVVALPKTAVDNFAKLFTVLPTLKFDVFTGTPSFAEMLLLSKDFNAEKMPDIKTFLLCGEELTVKTTKALLERFPNARIFDLYGPTEAAVAVTAFEPTKENIQGLDRLPVGYAKPGVQMLVMKDGQVLPAGEKGESIIVGDSVARGYMNNPEKTKAAFFKYEGQPAYHTGDLGILDEDGLLHHMGRMDFQIKLHGFRIELDEVRASLEKSPRIKQAVAVPRYTKDGQVSHLIAYVIPKKKPTDEKELTKQIRADLNGIIMDYMMPTQFTYRDSFPLSANGKIAVKALIKEANS